MLYRIYRRHALLSNAWRRRLTPAGWLTVLMTAVAAGVGVNTSEAVAYQLFTLLICLFAAALLQALFFRPKLRIVRRCPRIGAMGTPVEYPVAITNEGRSRVDGLRVTEYFPPRVPELDAFLYEPEPGERRRNAFDRALRYYRWTWLVRKARRVHTAQSEAFSLRPGETRDIRVGITPQRRGVLRLGAMEVARPDGFGLWCGIRRPAPAFGNTLTVLPRRYPLPHLEMKGRAQYQPCGAALAGNVGQSEEFIGLRDYRPGDPLRHFHWKSCARLGRPIVKEFEDEFFPRYALALDTFATYDVHGVFEEAVSIAASFACALDNLESMLDLMFVGNEAYCFTSGRGTTQPQHLLEVLASVDLCRDRPFDDLDILLRSHIRDVSACICVLLSWDPAREQFVQRLRAAGVDLLTLVLHPPGRPPEVEAAPDLRLIDVSRTTEELIKL